MPHHAISLDADGGGDIDGGAAAWTGLRRALAALPGAAPVIVLVHGYRYMPGHRRHCPHRLILSPRPGSWADRLGRGGALTIGVGWPARGSIWRASEGAALVGAGLARIMEAVADHRGRPAHAFAHSLGARAVLSAARRVEAGALGRAILLSAAAGRNDADDALARPGGRCAQVVNVTSRDNTLFDRLLSLSVTHGPALGAGLGDAASNWLDLDIDDPAITAAGYPIGRGARRICHRSAYLRQGVFPLYADLLSETPPQGQALFTRLKAESSRQARRMADDHRQMPGGAEVAR